MTESARQQCYLLKDRTMLKDRIRKKQDLTTDETWWSEENSASHSWGFHWASERRMLGQPKYCPRETLPPAWRSLENWCGSVFCSSNFTLFLIMQCLIQWRRDSTVPIAYSADSYPVGRYENSSESSAKKAVVNADIFISLANWTLLFLLINVSQPLSGPASFVSDLWAKSVHTSLAKPQTVLLTH